jgi:hypothetical protein
VRGGVLTSRSARCSRLLLLLRFLLLLALDVGVVLICSVVGVEGVVGAMVVRVLFELLLVGTGVLTLGVSLVWWLEG